MSIAAAAEGAVPAKGGKKKLLIIVLALVLVLAAAGGGLVFWLKARAHAAALAEEGDGAAEHAEGKAAHKRDPKEVPVFVPLDNFTVNLADREAERYAQIGISFELEDPKAGERIKVFMPAIRNNILMAIADRTAAGLLGREGKNLLAERVKRETSRALGYEVDDDEPGAGEEDKPAAKGRKQSRTRAPALPVKAVHFSNFIIQ